MSYIKGVSEKRSQLWREALANFAEAAGEVAKTEASQRSTNLGHDLQNRSSVASPDSVATATYGVILNSLVFASLVLPAAR